MSRLSDWYKLLLDADEIYRNDPTYANHRRIIRFQRIYYATLSRALKERYPHKPTAAYHRIIALQRRMSQNRKRKPRDIHYRKLDSYQQWCAYWIRELEFMRLRMKHTLEFDDPPPPPTPLLTSQPRHGRYVGKGNDNRRRVKHRITARYITVNVCLTCRHPILTPHLQTLDNSPGCTCVPY